jgi:hypothetical protein
MIESRPLPALLCAFAAEDSTIQVEEEARAIQSALVDVSPQSKLRRIEIPPFLKLHDLVDAFQKNRDRCNLSRRRSRRRRIVDVADRGGNRPEIQQRSQGSRHGEVCPRSVRTETRLPEWLLHRRSGQSLDRGRSAARHCHDTKSQR